MSFAANIKDQINQYMTHIPCTGDIELLFDFIHDEPLKKRIVQEYYNARYIYKFFEGMNAKGEMLEAESRLQVIMFSNIYEAILHYVLFTLYKSNARVYNIQHTKELRRFFISEENQQKLDRCNLVSKGGLRIDFIPCQEVLAKVKETQIRFDTKAKCAQKIGLIDSEMCDFLIEVYGCRNAIHLHADLRKGIAWNLDLSKKAYWKVKGFVEQLKKKLREDGLY